MLARYEKRLQFSGKMTFDVTAGHIHSISAPGGEVNLVKMQENTHGN